MTHLVDLDIEHDHVAIITLNRPKAANSMSIKLLDELNSVLQRIGANKQIYCTIITGAQNKVFCAGADLKEREKMSDEEVIQTVQYIGQTNTAIENLTIPVIAAINGVAFGGGLELALACDLRVAARHAKLGLPETSLAIIPGAGGTQRLPRLIGVGQAKRLIYTARPISADEAFQIGLVEKVTDSDCLLAETIKLAKAISVNGPIAIKQAKSAINQGVEASLATGLMIEKLCYTQTIGTIDRLEGLKAFKEKRKPSYLGK